MKKLLSINRCLFGLAILGMGLISCKNQEKTEKPSPVKETANSASEEEETAVVKVNPAHGLPGHTCALPVGAPLNSDVKLQTKTSKPSTTISPLRIDQIPKVNPPHGEPGHTCDLPVGAPLP